MAELTSICRLPYVLTAETARTDKTPTVETILVDSRRVKIVRNPRRFSFRVSV